MKPLGTITMCFPYIDEDTRTTLESIMSAAENFADFTERLCTKVCSEPSSPMLEYFAFYFPFHISDYNLVYKLVTTGKVTVLAKPLYLMTRYRRGEGISWDEMRQSLTEALEVAPNDWMSYHLYLKWRFYAEFNFPESDIDVKPVDVITVGVSENKELEFFKTYLLRLQAIHYHYDGDLEKQIELMNEALLIARKSDDQIVVADLLTAIAGIIKFSDVKRGLDLLNSSRELSEHLGYRYNIGHIQEGLAHIMGQQGKMDAAIKHLFEFERVRVSLGLPVTTLNYLFAIYYNLSGNGDAALNRVDPAIRTYESVRKLSSMPYALRAWALINLGRYDEARDELAIAQELALNSGVVWYRYIWNPTVEGILEKVERHFDNANGLFKGVLDYLGETSFPLIQNTCYLNLTEIEIEQIDIESLDKPINSSGPWMESLYEHLQNNDCPGIAAHALILKAKLNQKMGHYDEVRRLLREVLKIAEFPSMKYLTNIVTLMFPAIDIKTE